MDLRTGKTTILEETCLNQNIIYGDQNSDTVMVRHNELRDYTYWLYNLASGEKTLFQRLKF